MMRDLNDMALFALVVEAVTFTTATIRAGLPKSTVSRRLARPEARLGVRLIERSTRRLRVTEAGEAYAAHCRRILDEADRAELAVQDLLDAPRGPLRVSALISVGQCLLAPGLGPFLARYPDISVHLDLTNRPGGSPGRTLRSGAADRASGRHASGRLQAGRRAAAIVRQSRLPRPRRSARNAGRSGASRHAGHAGCGPACGIVGP